MKKNRFVAVLLAAIIALSAVLVTGTALADVEKVRIPATLMSGLYKNEKQGLKGFLTSEDIRCFVTLCAFLDWHSYDSKADCLLSQTYIGKDKEGELLWIGLGGRETSMILMYKPDTQPDYYTGMVVEFSGSFIPSFIDLYCEPLYHNDSTAMEKVLKDMSKLGK